MARGAALGIEGLAKAFGTTWAVRDFALDVGQGEFVALLGPSGCGKTTVLRSVAGIVTPDRGRIGIAGRDVTDLPPERRNVGLVFQSYALFPHLTVEANVGFGLRMRRVARDEARRRVAAALELVELGPLGARYPRALSGGQQQRVALARAVVIEPDLLLLDEPLSNLDARLRESLRDDLRALTRRLGLTTIHVTHDQAEAMALADRIVVMDQGRIVEQGAPEALYHRPRARFTAQFLGHVNLVEADASGGRVLLPWGASIAGGHGRRGRVTLAIRPEAIGLRPEPGGPGTVREAVFLGPEIDLRVAVGGHVLRVRTTEPGLARPGLSVALELPSDPHCLDEGAAIELARAMAEA